MKYLKFLKTTIYYLVCVLLIVVASTIIFSFFETPWGYKLYVVQSGSMEPTIKTGSVVFVAAKNEYHQGDIVTFSTDASVNTKDPKNIFTHRIFSEGTNEKGIWFTTKGDANNTPDLEKIHKEQVLGKTFLAIPYVGYLVALAKTQMGLIALVIIPGTLIIYSELMTIKNEAIRLIRERRVRKLTPIETVEEKVGEEIVEVEKEVKKVFKKKKKQKNG